MFICLPTFVMVRFLAVEHVIVTAIVLLFVDKQMDKQWEKHNLLGGGNYQKSNAIYFLQLFLTTLLTHLKNYMLWH